MKLLDETTHSTVIGSTTMMDVYQRPSQVLGSLSSISSRDARWGEQNPQWRAQVAAGQSAGTPFRGERTFSTGNNRVVLTEEHVPGSIAEPSRWPKRSETVGYFNLIGALPAFASISAYSISKAESVALSAAHQKIHDFNVKVEGGVILGELQQTIALLSNTGKRLFSGMFSYLAKAKSIAQSGRYASKKDALAALADLWLEYSFGWRPLVNDVSDIISYLNSMQGTSIPSVARAVGSTTSSETYSTPHLIGATAPFLTYKRQLHSTVRVRYIVGLGAQAGSDTDVIRDIGLAPSNWLPTLWELVPWSFVVDYFSNIGKIISAVSNLSAGQRWVVRTVIKEATIRPLIMGTTLHNIGSMDPALYGSYQLTQQFTGKKPRCTRRIVERTIPGKLDVPGLVITAPGLSTAWINLAALFVAGNVKPYWR